MAKQLYPYQLEGSEFLQNAARSAFLADEMGLGKSVQAIHAADALGLRSILVICPKSVKMHWHQEFLSWQGISRNVVVIQAGNPRDQKITQDPHSVVIINYDLFSPKQAPWLDALLRYRWDLLILDEAHALKNFGANRTKNIYMKGLLNNVGRVWLLSGTPAPNHVGELWPHIYKLFPDQDLTFTNKQRFFDTYTKQNVTPWGVQVYGSKNVKHLKQRLNGWVLRRKKVDVLTELPSLRFVTEPLDIGHLAWDVRKNLLSSLTGWNFPPTADPDEILEVLKTQPAHLASKFRVLGTFKAPVAADWIQENIPDTRPVLIFAWHKSVIDSLMNLLAERSPVKIDGRTDSKARQRAIEDFQAGKTKTFIGQIAAAGEGITLTAASDVVFVESFWTPAKIHQAACRAHRIGQRNPVLARMLTIPGTIDHTIQKALVRKAQDIEELFG